MYRKVVWYLRGKNAYTKAGYEKAAKAFNATDLDVDLASKSFVVTGANSGIGYSTAHFLASKGGEVHMVCRSKDRGAKARDQIVTATQNEKVQLHILDMAEPSKIKAFASEFAQQHRCDVLVNNAGCMLHERSLTSDGLEKNFAVNTFGTYLITELLLPTLRKSSSPRVILVSSGGMLLEDLEVNDLNFEKGHFTGEAAYAKHKVVMVEQWAAQHAGVGFYTMHPGWADTPAFRDALPDFHAKLGDNVRTPEQGADTMMWLAAVKEIPAEWNGEFFEDRKPVAKHLPMAWTRPSDAKKQQLMDQLKAIATRLGVL